LDARLKDCTTCFHFPAADPAWELQSRVLLINQSIDQKFK